MHQIRQKKPKPSKRKWINDERRPVRSRCDERRATTGAMSDEWRAVPSSIDEHACRTRTAHRSRCSSIDERCDRPDERTARSHRSRSSIASLVGAVRSSDERRDWRSRSRRRSCRRKVFSVVVDFFLRCGLCFSLHLCFPSSFPNTRKFFPENFLKCNQTPWKHFPFPEISISGKYVCSGNRFTPTKHSLKYKLNPNLVVIIDNILLLLLLLHSCFKISIYYDKV